MPPNRRARLSAFYGGNADSRALPYVIASSADRYAYRGEWTGFGVVIRADLNGYSAWAREQAVAKRASLLNAFFSTVVPVLESSGGVYYRDEGDCIVGIFSEYFGVFDVAKLLNYCKFVAGNKYGEPDLSAKLTVVLDTTIAFFQKTHEVPEGDWSSEGEAFVRASRLEQAAQSRQRVYFFTPQYSILDPFVQKAAPGETYHWTVHTENVQVPGLALSGGWAEVTYLEYVPGGRR